MNQKTSYSNNQYKHTHNTVSTSNCQGEQELLENPEFIQYRKVYERAQKGEEFDYPIHMEIENIYACNLHCPHCAREHIADTAVKTMDLDLYKRVIDEGTAMGARSLGFAIWGEVFLDKHIFEKVDYAREKGILDIRLHSNGILVTEEIAEKIVKHGITWMSISLDACSPETFAHTRGGDYGKAVDSLGKIVNAKLRNNSVLPVMRVSFVKTSMNEHEVELFQKVFGAYFDVAIQDFQDPNKILPTSLEPSYKEDQNYEQCFSNFYKVFVRADGTVIPCCQDIESKINLGNMNDNSLYEIYNGPIAKDLRRQHTEKNITNPQCRTCLGKNGPKG